MFPGQHGQRPYDKGERIADEFEVRDVLGSGGFGIVYLVYHRDTRSTYALKTFRDDVIDQEAVRAQFRKEAGVWVTLDRHPNIVRAHRVVEFEDRLFVALEYIPENGDGVNSLDGMLAQTTPDLQQRLVWGIQFCQGMRHAFAHGLRCHRDIKPANIMIGADGVLKISDFGLAGALASYAGFHDQPETPEGPAHTMRGSIGTPTHMPPEQFVDAALCDQRSDIYSFGIVIYQMSQSGTPPFVPSPPRDRSKAEKARALIELRQMHFHAPVPKTSSICDPIIERCLAKNPGDRYQDFRALERDLRILIESEFGAHPPTPRVEDLEAWETNNKGASLHSLGEDEQALSLYDQALTAIPNFADAWNNKGISLQALGRLDAALQCFDRALAINAGLSMAWGNRGNCLAKLKRHHEAVNCLNEALKLEPHSAGTWLNRGNISLSDGNIDEAGLCFQKCLELNPRLAAGWFRLALCHQASNRPAEAVECFEMAITLRPAEINAWSGKAACLSVLGRNEEALASVRRAMEMNSADAGLWFTKAGIEDELSKVEDASESLNKFLSLAATADVDEIAYATKRLDSLAPIRSAIEGVREAERSYPRKQPHVTALTRLANAYQNDGNLQQAEALLVDALALVEAELGHESPYVAPVLNNLGYLLHSLRRLEEAEALLERAVAITEKAYGMSHVNVGPLLDNLGAVYDDLGRHAEAQRCYSRALEIKRQRRGGAASSV